MKTTKGKVSVMPYHLAVPGSLGPWTYEVPLGTWADIERASRVYPRHGAPRRVPRRSNGNSLPLIGLRPSIKLERQRMGMRATAQAVAGILPDGQDRALDGQGHSIAPEALA